MLLAWLVIRVELGAHGVEGAHLETRELVGGFLGARIGLGELGEQLFFADGTRP